MKNSLLSHKMWMKSPIKKNSCDDEPSKALLSLLKKCLSRYSRNKTLQCRKFNWGFSSGWRYNLFISFDMMNDKERRYSFDSTKIEFSCAFSAYYLISQKKFSRNWISQPRQRFLRIFLHFVSRGSWQKVSICESVDIFNVKSFCLSKLVSMLSND